jgi:tetratricopeptide (TPR) repeat protein
MDAQQTRQLARFLDADAYVAGVIHQQGGTVGARLRVVDVGGSGLAYSFAVADANPGTAEGLAEIIAQRLNAIIRVAERARDCEEQRRKGQLQRALESARKALETDPNLPAAHLCIAVVYETQRLGPDSIIAAATRALKGDSLSTHALETIFRNYQVKGDTATALRWAEQLVKADPSNKGILLGLITQLQLRKEYGQADSVLQWAISQTPGDQQLHDRRYQVCIEGGRWRCVLEEVNEKITRDSTLLGDTATLKVAIGAAQQAPDTQAFDRYTAEAVRRYHQDISFAKTRGAALEMRGATDSAITWYTRAYDLDTTDVGNALLVAKTIIEHAALDTAGVPPSDTVELGRRRAALADRLERARPFLNRGLGSPDTAIRINTAVMLLTGGSKLAQAAAYDRAYPWLDQLLGLAQPRTRGDTVGPRHQILVNGSFWYGLSSVLTLRKPLQEAIDKKSCPLAGAVNERLGRTRKALELGRRVHEPTARRMLDYASQYDANLKRVKQAYKCRNF